jgi:hypothetical protein
MVLWQYPGNACFHALPGDQEVLNFDDRDPSGTSSLPDLIRQSSPPIDSRGLDARVKPGHDMGSDQCNMV